MASGSGSQRGSQFRGSQFPDRLPRSTCRYTPYPPTTQTGRSPQVGHDTSSIQRASARVVPSAQAILTSPSRWDDTREQQANAYLNRLTPAYEAYYNAALPTTSTKRFRCTENTRVQVLHTILVWTYGNDGVKIYWLNGMAGTGKTTIAYTLCERLFKNGQLGASFFCSRNSPDCRDVNRIVPTIAYQLARYSSAYRKALCDVLRNDPDMAKRNSETQFEHLIVNPVAKIGDAALKNVVVVIDALDECTDIGGTKDILELLLRHADNLPLKFFVSSRPEPSISVSMESRAGALRSILWLHDIEQSLVEADIKTYLTQALESSDISPSDIDQLAALAGCLFIFASTAVRYIAFEHGGVDTKERLQNVLNGNTINGDRKYHELDNLYRTILAKALEEDKLESNEAERRRRVLWTVVCARESMNPLTLSELLDLGNERQIRLAIQSLQSVLHVSDCSEVVSTLHASFPDFLLNRDRSKSFFCDPNNHHSYLAIRCFGRMTLTLRFNICDLETSYLLDREVPGINDRVNAAISPGLFYACRYWSDHMARVQSSTAFLPPLNEFLRRQLLSWMEVLSLKGQSSHGEAILSKVLNWQPNSDELIELRDFVHDARNFATTFAANPCSRSTPHIYISILPFTSQESRVWQTYWPRVRGLIQVEGAALEARGKSALATWIVGDRVSSVVQSSDGKRIVCGSGDWLEWGAVGVWDASRGTCIVGPLKGYQRSVPSVALSPDSTRIASGSEDGTIRIWDASKGATITGPLYAHSQGVRSVAFSPNGAHFASGSDDRTIQIWDTHSGTPVSKPFKGHEDRVLSVAFSSDEKHLASGSGDHTIRVWDWRAGMTVWGPIQAHAKAVLSVAYSPDGLRLASGSEDCTVRVWDMPSRRLFAGPFQGHTESVSSVSFSPSGSQVVSGSHDHTIRVWDSRNGTLLAGPFEGHTDRVNSVLFTSDGTRIISGSDDTTIRAWDARHRTAGATDSRGHTSDVSAVTLSPDGERVASGSEDCTICVWDTHNGALIAGPLKGHSGPVSSVAFSPDGARIASGSADGTLRMWDASTGALLADSFEGHDKPVLVAFSSDGSRVVSGSSDATIRLWCSHSGALVIKPFIRDHTTDTVRSIAFSPDGARIVSSSSRSVVQMRDADNGTALWTSHAHTNDVTCVAFSSDGTRVLSGSWDCVILVLDASNGAVLHGPFTGHHGGVSSVAFSPDGTHVVSGSLDRTVRVWDVRSGIMVAGPLEGHTDRVSSVAFSPGGGYIISGSWDGTIRVWDLAVIAQAGSVSFDNWSINHDGWLITSHSQRVLWVPSDLRDRFGFLSPSSPVVMNARCTARVDASTLLGDRWRGCFND